VVVNNKLNIRYSYVRGIQEIKKAWNILQEGRVGIGRITHSLLEQSTERKPRTLKQISLDSGVNYSTLKTYYGFYVDIIQHLPTPQVNKLDLGSLGRTSKRLNRILGTGYEKGGKEVRGHVWKGKRRTTRLDNTRPIVAASVVRGIYKEEIEKNKVSLKVERMLRLGYEVVHFLREYHLDSTEMTKFKDLRNTITNEINKQIPE
jgi:hypothetical protein